MIEANENGGGGGDKPTKMFLPPFCMQKCMYLVREGARYKPGYDY